jgi:hypothetical protein
MSDTCFVCSGGTGKPRYHADSRGKKEMTSPCDSTVFSILALTRAEALRQYQGILRSLEEYRAKYLRKEV